MCKRNVKKSVIMEDFILVVEILLAKPFSLKIIINSGQ